MALVLPFLVVLLFGSIELGHYFYVEHQVVKGVRDGARYAARQPFSSISCPTATVPAGIQTAIQEVTRTGRLSGGTARVPNWANTNITVSVSCPATALTTGIYALEANAPQINIVANVPYTTLFGGLVLGGTGLTLNASQQAAVMGI